MPKPTTLREAWTSWVSASDYESHMTAVGQAQANAALVEAALRLVPPSGERLLIAGCGPGQMFDYLDTSVFSGYEITFTDVNPEFLGLLADRLADAPFGHRRLVDDIESSALEGVFDAALLVLVLEHVCWPSAVDSLVRLRIPLCYIVIQQNPDSLSSAVTPNRTVPDSIQIFHEVPPRLIPRPELVQAMERVGYRLAGEQSREVADAKQMLLLIFARTTK